jgi:phosphoglycerate dehydrogenase-like enzyme/glyoxylase-like metal-dependent hydrolase (beta-lactamase superfamily II)/CheY-like chemotaxis protein
MTRLLLVDDDPALVLAQVSHALGPLGVRVEVARSGEEGLRRMAAELPDAVLLDVGLPDLSGLEVFRRAREIDGRIPVIFVTASTAAEFALPDNQSLFQGFLMRLFVVCGLLLHAAAAAAWPPAMKFNEVKEIAPGVFFRYSSISATDKSVVFGGSNNVWVVFDDFVVVIDANFPKEAGDVIAAVKQTTDKPIRYVFDTHHHGDHAFGNAVFAKAGASVIAQANCARILRTSGARDFAEEGKKPGGRKDVAAGTFKAADVVFDDKLVLDDGSQRVEFLHFGHGHTAGDAVAYLPKHKVLCTGDACVNGAYNYVGQGDSASWIRALERMQQLDVRLVCPGHGPLAEKDLLEKQKRYFVDLRREVQKGIDARRGFEDILKNLELPWYKEWTGVPPPGDNVRHIYDELTGRVAPWDFSEDFGIYEGPSPTKESPGWEKPRRIVVPSGLMPGRLDELKRVAPEVEFIPTRSAEDAASAAANADAVLGFCTPEIIAAGRKLRWVQAGGEGAGPEVLEALAGRKVVLTSTRQVYGPSAADEAFALLLALTRWSGAGEEPAELHGKTMLVVGLGGTGMQIARRAHAFGMRVRAIDPRPVERPDFVFSLDRPDRLGELLELSDVVVLACPLTAQTRGLIDAQALKRMKKTAYLINVARGGLVRTGDLAEALREKRIAGVGLDVAEPEVQANHPLRKLPGVVFSARPGGQSAEGRERQWRLFRENVRRFAAGEPLLCVVEKDGDS